MGKKKPFKKKRKRMSSSRTCWCRFVDVKSDSNTACVSALFASLICGFQVWGLLKKFWLEIYVYYLILPFDQKWHEIEEKVNNFVKFWKRDEFIFILCLEWKLWFGLEEACCQTFFFVCVFCYLCLFILRLNWVILRY